MRDIVNPYWVNPGIQLTPASFRETSQSRVSGGPTNFGLPHYKANLPESVNSPVSSTVFVAPFSDPTWLETVKQNQLNFVNTSSKSRSGDNFVANLPLLNYMLEEGARFPAASSWESMGARGSKRSLDQDPLLMKHISARAVDFHANTVDDFIRKWATIGVFKNEVMGKQHAYGQQRGIHYVVSGPTELQNTFSATLKRGDQLFCVYKWMTPLNAEFVGPTGATVPCNSVNKLSKIPQVVCFSSRDQSPNYNTGAFEPDPLDTDYMDGGSISKFEGRIIELGTNGEILERRTDDLNDMPIIVQTQYERGHIMCVGVVEHPGPPANQKDILSAHRSTSALITLPLCRTFVFK
jgi:hypothetical protein